MIIRREWQREEDEKDFDLAVMSDVAGWLRKIRLHKYMAIFEGTPWKEMVSVVMDEQAIEAQGIATIGARKKMMPKTFEVVRRKIGTDG